jgi:flagella basal body P-ring formation protein FlgA
MTLARSRTMLRYARWISILAIALPVALRAQVAPRVAGQIARAWGVDSADVRIEWLGAAPAPALDTLLAETSPAGGAAWTVTLRAANGSLVARHELRAGVERDVPVASHDLARAVSLSSNDITLHRTLIWGVPKRIAQVGWITRRVVALGTPLFEPAVAPAPLVAAGSAVDFIWQRDGVALSLRGTAATSATLGDRVWVRFSANHSLQGTVVGPSRVASDDKGRTS